MDWSAGGVSRGGKRRCRRGTRDEKEGDFRLRTAPSVPSKTPSRGFTNLLIGIGGGGQRGGSASCGTRWRGAGVAAIVVAMDGGGAFGCNALVDHMARAVVVGIPPPPAVPPTSGGGDGSPPPPTPPTPSNALDGLAAPLPRLRNDTALWRAGPT